MAGCMLPMEHPVGQAIHRPRPSLVRTNQRCIHRDKYRFPRFLLPPDRCQKLLVPLRIGKPGHPSPLSVPLQKAKPVVLFFPPRQIHTYQQNFHLLILAPAPPQRKADPQIVGSRLTTLLG